MASVVFLYRSTKDSACLTARLLFRLDKKDFILASKTKLEVTKTYWNKKHTTKSKDISVIRRVPQHYIASYLRIKPQSLSRIHKNLLF